MYTDAYMQHHELAYISFDATIPRIDHRRCKVKREYVSF